MLTIEFVLALVVTKKALFQESKLMILFLKISHKIMQQFYKSNTWDWFSSLASKKDIGWDLNLWAHKSFMICVPC